MSELPKGWSIAMIGQIADINPRHPRNLEDSLAVTFVRMPALSETSWKFESTEERLLGEVRKGFTHFAEGDVLFAKITPCMENGKAAVALDLINGLGCGTTELHVMRPYGCVDSKYLFYFVHQESFREQAARNFTGTAGQLRVPVTFIKDAEIPIPPLNEQRRIVAKLEKLLNRVHAAQERLATIAHILKRFRQSVLSAACAGKLTADWRGTNEDDGSDLPVGWKRTLLEKALAENGIFDGPFGSNLKTSDYTTSGVRVIRLENIGCLNFIREKETYITPEKYNTLIRHSVGEGDLIFASFIANEIRACVLPSLSTKAIAKADCFCLRPNPSIVDRTYLSYQLVSRESYDNLIESVHGATRPRINTTQLRKLDIRLCPVGEQQEIVRRVEALFKTADALEARYLKAKAHVDKLTQSILAKAFRGELVPQDPNDEPASVLLKRIDQNRNGNEVPRRRSRK